jgi:hypothetical protein
VLPEHERHIVCVLTLPFSPLKEPDVRGNVGIVVNVLLYELHVTPFDLEARVLLTANFED